MTPVAAGRANPPSETSGFCPDNCVPDIVTQAWHWCFTTFSFFKLDTSRGGELGSEEVKKEKLDKLVHRRLDPRGSEHGLGTGDISITWPAEPQPHLDILNQNMHFSQDALLTHGHVQGGEVELLSWVCHVAAKSAKHPHRRSLMAQLGGPPLDNSKATNQSIAPF